MYVLHIHTVFIDPHPIPFPDASIHLFNRDGQMKQEVLPDHHYGKDSLVSKNREGVVFSITLNLNSYKDLDITIGVLTIAQYESSKLTGSKLCASHLPLLLQ